jgi:predicted lipoprotein with Yx(FWY)xxD motif
MEMAASRTLRVLAGGLALSAVVWVAQPSVWGADFTVRPSTATVAGRSLTVLVDANGFALYYLTSDRGTVSACTGACANVWPPLLTGASPTGPSSLPGKLTLVTTIHGTQTSYDGHLLYRYAGDSQPGQVTGHDRGGPGGGRWLVATPRIAEAGSGAPGDRGGNDSGDKGY